MCDSFNKQLLQMGGNSVPAHKGVVHGHIHNYNNLTYIHGHIHKNDVEDGAVPDPDDVLNCAQYQDCEHFEFINCHSLNLFGENGDTNEKQPAVQSNSSQHHLEQQNEQKGPPRFVEITSDDKNEAVPNSLSNALDFLDCHLTCDSPMLEDEDEDEDIEDEDDEEGRGKGRGDEEYTKKELDKILNNDSTSNLNLGAISQQHLQALDNGATSSNNSSKLIHSENFKIANPTLNTPLLNEENGNLTVGVDHLQNGLPDPLSINMKNEQAHQLEDEMNRFLTPSSTNSQNLSVKRESPKSINPSAVNVMDISVKHNNNRDLLGLKPELKSEELHDLKQQCIDMEDNDDDKDTSVDDQLFENLCSQCVVNYELMETPHFHHNSHSHIINTPTDMKVLKDLSSISTLYELLGKHEHTHDNLNENNPQHHDHVSMNLLHCTLNGYNEYNHTENQHIQLKQSHDHECDHDHDHDDSHQHPDQNMDEDKEEDEGKNHHYHHGCGQTQDQEYAQLPLHSHRITSDLNTDLIANTINFNWSFNTNNEPIYCQWDDCLQPYDNLLDLQTHVLKDHVAIDDSKVLSCKWTECDFNTADPCTMVNHVNGKHGINFDVKVLDNKTMAKQVTAHKKLHEEPQSCICKWAGCNKEFDSAKSLNEHIENFHVPSGLSSYKCEWEGCNKVFVQKQKLIRHLKVHSKYKPFRCAECGKCFNTQDILTQHLRVHSGERPFKCHLCPKSYSTSSSLRIHIRTHTGEKPLSCPICNKRFNESSNLAKHIRTHKRENCRNSKRV